MDTIVTEFENRQKEIDAKLTPPVATQIFLPFEKEFYENLKAHPENRVVLITFASTAALLRRIKGQAEEKPMSVQYTTVQGRMRKFLNLEACGEIISGSKTASYVQKDLSSFLVVVGTYLPIGMLGGPNMLYTHSLTALKFRK
jgi:hypothetical protein